MPTAELTHALEFVSIPGGCFWMGDEAGQVEERPVHEVELREFALGRFPVTRADYASFLLASGHEAPRDWDEPPFAHAEAPVCGVSWFDALAFCEWLGTRTGARYGLPTEAQRERAARAGVEGVAYPWGAEAPALEGAHARGLSGAEVGAPRPVGALRANPWGLVGMGEGVHEWCSDWFAADWYAHSPRFEPCGPASGTRRASRGGSWRHDLKFSRCAQRSRLGPEKRFTDYGFRVVRGA